MVRTSLNRAISLLFAACFVAAALAFVGASPAYAADDQVTVTVTVDNLGRVDVVEGENDADPGQNVPGGSKTISLSNVTADKGGKIAFATETTNPFACIQEITITYKGQTRVVATCKPGDPSDGFYDVGDTEKVIDNLRIGGGLTSNPYPDVDYESPAPGESFKRSASFDLSRIEDDVVINVRYDLTQQQTLTFHRNYDESDSDTVGTPHYYHYGEQLGDAPAVPAREGYTFLGWATTPDGQPEEWNPEALMYGESLNFYAIWQKNEESQPLPPAESEEDAGGNDSSEKDDEAPSEDEPSTLAKTGDGMTASATAAVAGALASSAIAVGALACSRRRSER